MTESRRCPQCGNEFPPDAPVGLCPQCLLKQGRESATGSGIGQSDLPPTAFSGGNFVPPRPAELAPHFPNLEIQELLGKGGMGAVYKARQPHLDRFVALKILPPAVGEDPAFQERFTREARALARLSHPHIVAVYDFGEAEGLYYFLMEYVDGANIRRLIQQGGLKAEEALAIVPQICDALQYAHDEGIVHRDIKPENILINKKGRVKIADFGLAKLVASGGRQPADVTLTGTAQVMGTLHYMAPEQMRGSHAVDHRADIYSLGVVFYEMLTGELPIGKFEAPSKKVQIDVRLDQVVLRALENQPERRYQKASEVKSDVEAISSSVRPQRPMQEVLSKESWIEWPYTVRRYIEPLVITAFLLLWISRRFFELQVSFSAFTWPFVVVVPLAALACFVKYIPYRQHSRRRIDLLARSLHGIAAIGMFLVSGSITSQVHRWYQFTGENAMEFDRLILGFYSLFAFFWTAFFLFENSYPFQKYLEWFSDEPGRRDQNVGGRKSDAQTISGSVRPPTEPTLAQESVAAEVDDEGRNVSSQSDPQRQWAQGQICKPGIALVLVGLLSSFWLATELLRLTESSLKGEPIEFSRDLLRTWPGPLILVAALMMINLKGYWLAVIASVLAMVVRAWGHNFVWLWLQMGVGVWCLITLANPQVQRSFGKRGQDGTGAARAASGAGWKVAVSAEAIAGALAVLAGVLCVHTAVRFDGRWIGDEVGNWFWSGSALAIAGAVLLAHAAHFGQRIPADKTEWNWQDNGMAVFTLIGCALLATAPLHPANRLYTEVGFWQLGGATTFLSVLLLLSRAWERSPGRDATRNIADGSTISMPTARHGSDPPSELMRDSREMLRSSSPSSDASASGIHVGVDSNETASEAGAG